MAAKHSAVTNRGATGTHTASVMVKIPLGSVHSNCKQSLAKSLAHSDKHNTQTRVKMLKRQKGLSCRSESNGNPHLQMQLVGRGCNKNQQQSGGDGQAKVVEVHP